MSVRWIGVMLVVFMASGGIAAQEPMAFTLANGLRVRLAPNRDEKRVSVILGVRAGFLDEPQGVPHLAHVTEHLAVFDLAGAREKEAVARWYKQNGANGETLTDFMYLDLHVAAEELPLALQVQAGRLGALRFTAEALAREVPRTLQEIEFLEASELGGTSKFALAPFVQAAFFGLKDVPIKAQTAKITLEQVSAYHRRTFRTDRAQLVIVGDFDPQATRKQIEDAFGKLSKPERPPVMRPALRIGTHRVTWDVPTRHLLLAWPTPAADKPEHAALTVAATALMLRLYRDPELLKLAKTPLVSNNQEGLFLVNLQLKADADADKARTLILERLSRMARGEDLTNVDLGVTRLHFAQLSKPLNLDNVRLPPNVTRTLARANVELQRMMHESVWGDLAAYQKRLEGLDATGVAMAVGKYLDVSKAAIVQVEPTKKPG